jgi:hypothetical protein
MNGLQALKEIRAFDGQARVLMVTALGQQSVVRAAQQLFEHQGDGVHFLARRAGGAPDVQRNGDARRRGLLAPVNQLGQQLVLEQFEGGAVAEERRFAGRDSVDNLAGQRVGRVSRRFDVQLGEATAAGLLEQRR